MDLAVYIYDLLLEHDCVIVPGFGGFIANYKSAEIDHVLHCISPPSKNIAFNKNLNANDGLLLHYISNREICSYSEATEKVSEWVAKTQQLLLKNEEINLSKIGKLSNDIERNLQFVPDSKVNFLKSSFGLRTLNVAPILRGKSAATIEVQAKHRPSYELLNTANSRRRSMATVIILFLLLFGIVGLMNSPIHPKSLNLNSASVLNCLETIFRKEEVTVKPVIKVEVPTIATVTEEMAQPISTSQDKENVQSKVETASVSSAGYYIIVGAFAEQQNISRAEDSILEHIPNAVIFKEQYNGLTRVGYKAGSTFRESLSQLNTAQNRDSDCWLLTKM